MKPKRPRSLTAALLHAVAGFFIAVAVLCVAPLTPRDFLWTMLGFFYAITACNLAKDFE